jgi:ATP-dependent helicase HrpA
MADKNSASSSPRGRQQTPQDETQAPRPSAQDRPGRSQAHPEATEEKLGARGNQGTQEKRRPRRKNSRRRNTGAEHRERRARLAAARAAHPVTVSYPEDLPVTAAKDEIAEAIRDNQVVIIAGETGSGKTTQLPKICLDLGLGVNGLIGHTQPRRIAARTVAERIADELDEELGNTIGYQVRFTAQVADSTRVKVMTDGILLSELSRDKLLRDYEVIIIDEAHERSLNIDFLLGYLREVLDRRPDLKVIITSATIDPESFSAHFGDAPIISVEGRTFPVEVRYRPLGDDPDDDDVDGPGESGNYETGVEEQTDGIISAVDELAAEAPGDILVFLSGEREIRDTADALNDHLRRRPRMSNWEVVPLFARLSAGEQQKVFKPHSRPRIVLATNVAETSLTVPGIKYVIDVGTARISRYSNRTRVQRLPIERISQASANQRKGRSGRTSEGICIRLYSQEDFESRPEFTDPEILRTNLASVILQMASLGFASSDQEILDFPFLTPPEARAVRDGRTMLTELGALTSDSAGKIHVTETGRKLTVLPIDPRLARMVIAGAEAGCGGEVTVIVAALSIQDPGNGRPRSEPPPMRNMPGSLTGAVTSCPTSTCGTTCRACRPTWDPRNSVGGARKSSSISCASANGRISSVSCARCSAPQASESRSRSGSRPTTEAPMRLVSVVNLGRRPGPDAVPTKLSADAVRTARSDSPNSAPPNAARRSRVRPVRQVTPGNRSPRPNSTRTRPPSTVRCSPDC